jgi:hypothetical protein
LEAGWEGRRWWGLSRGMLGVCAFVGGCETIVDVGVDVFSLIVAELDTQNTLSTHVLKR